MPCTTAPMLTVLTVFSVHVLTLIILVPSRPTRERDLNTHRPEECLRPPQPTGERAEFRHFIHLHASAICISKLEACWLPAKECVGATGVSDQYGWIAQAASDDFRWNGASAEDFQPPRLPP